MTAITSQADVDQAPKTGRNGINVNDLATPETRRKGALAAAAKRAEEGKSARQKLADKIDKDVNAVYASFKNAWKQGDWRAADAALNQAFGRPDGRMDLAITGSLEVEHSRRLSLADVAGLAAELGAAQPAIEPASEPTGE